ncbi:Diacylglycerol kinase [Planctomycetes bacterium Pan216]|uniref:Diacylglycerol kinase n=1 Tax=Kolteria novifilia TaxID=2527975 RepID=A0A518B5W4_9BACT|nr:Diacylglycerol kinase [Planctomycetes bacterium Pan216]
MKTVVIVNSNAGGGTSREEVEAACACMGDLSVVMSEAPGDAERLAREAVEEGADRVFAAGGDGTVNEVLNGLADGFDRVEMGILPMGTGNDLARCLGLPPQLLDAVTFACDQPSLPTDVVHVHGETSRFVLNVSAGGFGPMVGEKLTSESKTFWGPLAYMKSAVESLAEIEAFRCRVVADEEPMEASLLNVVVANGTHVAGGIPIAPSAKLDDGYFDVLLFPDVALPDLAVLVPMVLAGVHEESERLIRRRCRSLRIESDPQMMFNVDGEIFGGTPLAFDILPRVLRLVRRP